MNVTHPTIRWCCEERQSSCGASKTFDSDEDAYGLTVSEANKGKKKRQNSGDRWKEK